MPFVFLYLNLLHFLNGCGNLLTSEKCSQNFEKIFFVAFKKSSMHNQVKWEHNDDNECDDEGFVVVNDW